MFESTSDKLSEHLMQKNTQTVFLLTIKKKEVKALRQRPYFLIILKTNSR